MEHLLKQLMQNPQVALDLLKALKDINAITEINFVDDISRRSWMASIQLVAQDAIAKAEANHITTKPLPEALAHEAAAVGARCCADALEQGEPS